MSQLFSDTAKNRQIGIALVTVTTLMFATLDTSAKWLVQSVPVLQVVWLRFLFHTILTTAIFMPSMGKQLFSIQNPRLQLLRGVMLAIMTGLNFFALQYLQLAEVGAVQFSVPLLIALISAWFLHEKLDAQRWWAIGLGIVWALLLGFAFGRWLHWVHAPRMEGLDRATTYFAGPIGGASEMTLLAERAMARTDLVASAHSLRVLIVTVVVPFGWMWRQPLRVKSIGRAWCSWPCVQAQVRA